MIRSFLNAFLPEDEYKRTRILYFMAETTFLTIVILLVLGLLKYFLNINIDTQFILLIGPFLMMGYSYFRYIFSGIEHTEVSDKQDYIKRRRKVVKRSLLVGVIFFIIILIVKGIPGNWEDRLDLIALPILFTIFYFLFDYISLKRSYKKNKDLTDD
ncbi:MULTISPECIES: hypothetical protein [unclassified Oceanobacillus]|uniref:hypothetical protein n=1 Tax=unclassified Oceanobacillus TaxID=2630292 RepID=UPI00300E03B4